MAAKLDRVLAALRRHLDTASPAERAAAGPAGRT
jgi:hypothetical protein